MKRRRVPSAEERGLAERILQARRRLGLTQAQVCARVGVTLRTFGRWEQTQRAPPLWAVLALQGVLGPLLPPSGAELVCLHCGGRRVVAS